MTESGDNQSQSHGSSTSYGKACLICSRSKIRCVTTNNFGKCDRCQRLNKTCHPITSVRTKKVIQKSSSTIDAIANKTAVLEEKLDGIVQLLERSNAMHAHTASSSSEMDTLASSAVRNGQNLEQQQIIMDYTEATRSEDECARHGFGPSTDDNHDATVAEPPSMGDSSCQLESSHNLSHEDQLLLKFRHKMLPCFPIVHIPENLNAEILSQQRPFQWLVIIAISCPDARRQLELGQEVRQYLAKEALMNGIKSLDLLLGLLVLIGWNHYFIHRNPIISYLVQMAIAIASELGLNKPLPAQSPPVMLHYTAPGCPKPPNYVAPTQRTVEERRALLGLYLASSKVSQYFQKIEPLPWTSYIDECLRVLEVEHDAPHDEALVYMVRVQAISNKVSSVAWHETFPMSDTGKQFPREFYTNLLRSKLEIIENSVPSSLESHVVLKLQILDTTLTIHEHSLSVSSANECSFNPDAEVIQLENLWTCFTTVKAFFNIIYSEEYFTADKLSYFSFYNFTKVAHCMIALFRLITFESPGLAWDRKRILADLDFRQIVRHWRVQMEQCINNSSTTGEVDSAWQYSLKALLAIEAWWDTKVFPALDGNRVSNSNGKEVESNEQTPTTDSNYGLLDFDLNLLDDPWLKEIFGAGLDFLK